MSGSIRVGGSVALVQGREVTEATELLADRTISQRIFDAVPDLIFILDERHRIIRANQRLIVSKLSGSAQEI